MKNYKTIIIGCGASGAMCAISAKSGSVAVIDAASKPFKKILVTGNGRCNITNTNVESKYYNQNIDKYLNKFNVKQTLDLFCSLGLEWYEDDEGRVYPLSNQAKSVQDIVVNKLEKCADLYLEHKVIDITKTQTSFVVKTDKQDFACDKLVVATGGNTMIGVVSKLGVKTKNNNPSLVAIKCSDVKDLNGVRIDNVQVTATLPCGTTKTDVGEVLFKDQGFSGIVIFNLSTLFARTGSFKGKLSLDIMPYISIDDLADKIKLRRQLNVNLDKLFVGMFNNALSNEIFRQAKTNTNKNSLKLTDIEAETLAKTIKNLTFNVVDCYDNNQVYSGGVLLECLTDNLMSKDINNLYFTGEVCDVDGECGGYNLQWAWTSGHIVGENL